MDTKVAPAEALPELLPPAEALARELAEAAGLPVPGLLALGLPEAVASPGLLLPEAEGLPLRVLLPEALRCGEALAWLLLLLLLLWLPEEE